MNRRLQAYLVSLMMGAISGAVFAQSGVNVPLQRGVSVQLAVTSNAVAVPNADKQDALVVALTADGSIYLRGDRLPTPALADRVRSILSTRNEKTLYIKADARAPYGRLVEVIDAVRNQALKVLRSLRHNEMRRTKGRSCRPRGLKCGSFSPEATSQRNQRREECARRLAHFVGTRRFSSSVQFNTTRTSVGVALDPHPALMRGSRIARPPAHRIRGHLPRGVLAVAPG